jgi:hypothetical protein
MTEQDLQEIDKKIVEAAKMQNVFLGLSAMWRRKAAMFGKRIEKYQKCKERPALFRIKKA